MKRTPSKAVPALDPVALANAALVATDRELEQRRSRIQELREQMRPLLAYLNEVHARPSPDIGPDPAQVAALLADPSARPDMADITAVVSAARKTEDVRRLEAATAQAAINSIHEAITVVEGEISALRLRRTAEMLAFARLAGKHLAARFEAEFSRLRDEVMRPLLALAHLRDDGGNALPLAGEGLMVFLPNSRVRTYEWRAPQFGQGALEKTHFEAPVYMDDGEVSALLNAFRSTLPAIVAGTLNQSPVSQSEPIVQAQAQPANDGPHSRIVDQLRRDVAIYEQAAPGVAVNAAIISDTAALIREARLGLNAADIEFCDRLMMDVSRMRDTHEADGEAVARGLRRLADLLSEA